MLSEEERIEEEMCSGVKRNLDNNLLMFQFLQVARLTIQNFGYPTTFKVTSDMPELGGSHQKNKMI